MTLAVGKRLFGGESATGVKDRHPVPHLRREAGERLADVHRPHDHQLLWRGEGFDEDGVWRVFQRAVLLVVHQENRVGDDVGGEPFGKLAGDHLPTGIEDHFVAGHRPVDEGEHGPILLPGEDALDCNQGAHQGSMKTSMVPPQAMPTSNASSSAIP